MNRSKGVGLSMVATGVILIAAGRALAGHTVFSAGGSAEQSSIQGVVDAFRVAVGQPNHGSGGGPFTTGRREINWDGAAIPADPAHMPGDFFNNNVKRGALFTTPGAGFFVSRRNPGDPTDANLRFGSINPGYSDEFGVFSSQRLFVADGSTVTDVLFRVPVAPDLEATVNGFGAVFTDVDVAGSSWMEFYGLDGSLLHTEFVPVSSVAQKGLSFLGVTFEAERVGRVRIVSGNAALGAGVNDGTLLDTGVVDVVAMDDFIYGEPVPGPAAATLGCAGLLACSIRRRR
ncbi:MAG: hypothetical protein AMXMBFR58_09260 [Phycisphaerae bacterium]